MIETRKSFRKEILWASILILSFLANSCTTKKTTGPVEPTVYLMKDYFPLNEGDEWIWEVVVDSIEEPFVDGDINLGEPFIDINENGIYDEAIDSFDNTMDLNENGKYDGPDDSWTPGIPYEDRNGNGEYDAPNGKWDEGELFVDLNGDGIWNATQQVGVGRLKAGVGAATFMSSDGSVIFGRGSSFLGPPGWSFLDWPYTDDGFSNDSLGLRWHWHADCSLFSRQDDLKDHAPVTIAKANIKVGDSEVSVDTSYAEDEISGIYTWISIFERVEDVCVPAGGFRNCLKFKTFASGWEGNMAKYNGTSYQWYARNVGPVKSEGPNTDECWRLESATTSGQSYP